VLLNNEVCGSNWRRFRMSADCCCCRSVSVSKDKCPAPFDEFGLLSNSAGFVPFRICRKRPKSSATRAGGRRLRAGNGAHSDGKIDALVGVSCLFSSRACVSVYGSGGHPGIAIPLLQDDCKDTGVDIEWVWACFT